MKDIDADYYGYRDEDDGIIVPLEIEAERKGTLINAYMMHVYIGPFRDDKWKETFDKS